MTGSAPARILTIFSPLPQQRVTVRFTVALAAAALAILLRKALDPVLGHLAFYVTVYMAVAFCAVVSGFVPAILSAVIGFWGVFYWFVDPRLSFSLTRPSEIHGIVGFFLVCIVLITLGDSTRRKQLRLNETVISLTFEAEQRKRAEQELQEAHDELERRVADRTSALAQALTTLQSEVNVRELAEEQLRHLSVRLMTLQDEERRRIARELHDTTGQILAAIKMTLAGLQQIETSVPDIMRLVNDLNTLTDSAVQEVRTTSYLLHPPLLDEVGIAAAARWFVEGFAKRSGIELTCAIPETIDRPPRHSELVLFRVLQESLTNIHRHSGASAASVKFVLDIGWLKLEVADNGHGIPEERLKAVRDAAGSAGVGVAGMRERVRELGGRFDIQSDRTGTTVSVTVPTSKTSALSVSSLSSTSSKYLVEEKFGALNLGIAVNRSPLMDTEPRARGRSSNPRSPAG
jgi:signal transduction histidine kinase